jgi:uncharacterized protein (DUF952 family)
VSLYHILEEPYLAVDENDTWAPDSFPDDGFIHLCLASQIEGVIKRYFAGAAELYVVEIELSKDDPNLLFEDPYGRGEEFPHYYGRIPVNSVRKIERAGL